MDAPSHASAGLGSWFSLVKFRHSIFALPFALMSAWLAAWGPPSARVLALILLCAVAARTAAMAFNRWLDRDIDAANPRTSGREIPAGVLSARSVLVLALASSIVFIAGAFALNPLAGKLSFPVLAVLLGYSAVKRFHWSAHLVLGLALGLAPLGAWIAVRGDVGEDAVVPLCLAAAVLAWVAGFDLIYACQDADFDRARGLHSIPARFGARRALVVSRLLHLLAFGLLALLWWLGRADFGPLFPAAILIAGGLFVWQHRIVSAEDLSRVDMAFFTLNGWVGVLLFLGLALDLAFGVHW